MAKNIIYAIGNDHAGVYYPAITKAVDFIIEIERNASNKVRKICALAILNDLYYFEPEIGDYAGCSADELKRYVKEKLRTYSDENIKF